MDGPQPQHLSEMRVALFGSGSPMSVQALETLGTCCTVVAVVAPGSRRGRGLRRWWRQRARRRGRAALMRAARARRIPVFTYAPGSEATLAARLLPLRPELLCVATFPYLLPPTLLGLAPRGAIGLHPSLLPRHRGPDPLFWTYFAGDREAGVTVFWLDESEDGGDLIGQEVIPLLRGRPGRELYGEVARRGATLLARSVVEIAEGTAPRRPQDAGSATREGLPRPSTCRVDLQACGAEWLWHFLAGVGPHRPFVAGAAGRPLLHGRARGYGLERRGEAGTVEALPGGWRLHCRDGFVDVERASLAARARRFAARLLRSAAA